jgi:2-polyprenyl-3-methyl-5-hydroxy-6-metoxy-1,4-benzoquinol methylase
METPDHAIATCTSAVKQDIRTEQQHFDQFYVARRTAPADPAEAEYRRRALHPSHLPLDYWEYLFYVLGDVRGKRVLDIGCGGGWISRLLAAKGARVTACDVSIEGCRLTRGKFLIEGSANSHVSVQDAHYIAMADNQFDAVVSTGVLHHLNIPVVAREIHRVLKPSGRLIFAEPLRYGVIMWKLRKAWLWVHGQQEDSRTDHEESLGDAELAVLYDVFRSGRIRKFNFLAKTNRLRHRFGPFAKLLRWTDYILLAACPFLRRFCTSAMGEFSK